MARAGTLHYTSRRRKGSIRFMIAPHRHSIRKTDRFMACVWIGGKSRRGSSSTSCMYGSNPRRALARALQSLAKSKLGARKKGAFRSFKGRR